MKSFAAVIDNMQDTLCGLDAHFKWARRNWNGRNMYIVVQKGYPDGVPINKNTAEATRIPEGTVIKFRPYIMMYTAQGDFVPWVASQSDILATDWEVID